MDIRLRVHHWVVWWFWLAVIFSGVSLLNVLVRNLTRPQDKVVAIVSALFWVIGGIFCYAVEGVQVEHRRETVRKKRI